MKNKGIQKAIAHQFCVDEQNVNVEFIYAIENENFFDVSVNHNDGKQSYYEVKTSITKKD